MHADEDKIEISKAVEQITIANIFWRGYSYSVCNVQNYIITFSSGFKNQYIYLQNIKYIEKMYTVYALRTNTNVIT